MYVHVPKNLFPKWHSVGNTVRSQRSKTFQQSYIDTCSTAKTTKQFSLLLLAVQRQLPTVKVTHFLTSSNVNHFNHTYHITYTYRYFSYDQRAPRHSCHHRLHRWRWCIKDWVQQGYWYQKEIADMDKGHFFILSVVVATLTLGSPFTSKHLIMLTCQISTCILPFMPI